MDALLAPRNGTPLLLAGALDLAVALLGLRTKLPTSGRDAFWTSTAGEPSAFGVLPTPQLWPAE